MDGIRGESAHARLSLRHHRSVEVWGGGVASFWGGGVGGVGEGEVDEQGKRQQNRMILYSIFFGCLCFGRGSEGEIRVRY